MPKNLLLPKITAIFAAIFCALLWTACSSVTNTATAPGAIYEYRTVHDPDGIGKFYMGREIAQVMGHQGAFWLERSSREAEERPSLLVNSLDLQPDDIVADIGAGSGYISFQISPQVPQGKVLAVDIQPEMLDLIKYRQQEIGITNVSPLLGTTNDPYLPADTVDLAIMVDAYHEFEYPQEMMQGIVNGLKPGGRVVLVEYRGENPLILIKPLHKMTQKQVRLEMESVGLVWRETKNMLPQQHVMVFEKI